MQEDVIEVSTVDLYDLLHEAWGVIANAGGWPAGPTEPTEGWADAAAAWRDRFHQILAERDRAEDIGLMGGWKDAGSVNCNDYTSLELHCAGALSTMEPFASRYSPRALPFARKVLMALETWESPEEARALRDAWHDDDCAGYPACSGCGYIAADMLWYPGPCPDVDKPHQRVRSELGINYEVTDD